MRRRAITVMSDDTCSKYEKLANWFDDQRSGNHTLMEREYLETILAGLPPHAHILDIGCGAGEPIAGFFIRAGHRVTGIDGSPAMVEKCRQRFPKMNWHVSLMQTVDLPGTFDAVIAWDSMFHISQDDQRGMFPLFDRYCKPGGFLLFTSGPNESNISGEMEGITFPYSSLSPTEYMRLLEAHRMQVLLHRVNDPQCGNHTVWLAKKIVENR